jgi:hypothetical protein
MRMSAPAFVSEAMRSVAQKGRLPDVVYLLNVTFGNPVLLPIYDSGVWWHDTRNTGWLVFSDARSAEFNTFDPLPWPARCIRPCGRPRPLTSPGVAPEWLPLTLGGRLGPVGRSGRRISSRR